MIFRTLRLKRTAQRYALILPRWLATAYGNKKSYTEAQLRSAVSRNGLDVRFIGIAFGAYLTKSEFEALSPSLPVPLEYETARELFVSCVPAGIASADGFLPPDNSDAIWGASDSNN